MNFLTFGLFGALNAQAARFELVPTDDIVARTEAIAQGDEIILADGTYRIDRPLNWSVQASAPLPITLTAAEGAQPIIELVPNKNGEYAGQIMNLSDSAYINIEGITFQCDLNWVTNTEDPHEGIRITNSSNITLRDVEIRQTGRSALVFNGETSEIIIERSHIHDTLDGHGIYFGCQDASCLSITAQINNNWIHNIGGDNKYALFLAHGSQDFDIIVNVIYGEEFRVVYLG